MNSSESRLSSERKPGKSPPQRRRSQVQGKLLLPRGVGGKAFSFTFPSSPLFQQELSKDFPLTRGEGARGRGESLSNLQPTTDKSAIPIPPGRRIEEGLFRRAQKNSKIEKHRSKLSKFIRDSDRRPLPPYNPPEFPPRYGAIVAFTSLSLQ